MRNYSSTTISLLKNIRILIQYNHGMRHKSCAMLTCSCWLLGAMYRVYVLIALAVHCKSYTRGSWCNVVKYHPASLSWAGKVADCLLARYWSINSSVALMTVANDKVLFRADDHLLSNNLCIARCIFIPGFISLLWLQSYVLVVDTQIFHTINLRFTACVISKRSWGWLHR